MQTLPWEMGSTTKYPATAPLPFPSWLQFCCLAGRSVSVALTGPILWRGLTIFELSLIVGGTGTLAGVE